MKTFRFFIVYIIFCICSSNVFAKEIQYMEIRKVDMDDKTFIRVSCDNFETFFNDVRILIITDTGTIHKITDLLDKMKKYPSDYLPDVRAKLLIYYDNNTIDTVCMSYLGVLINEIPFELDNELIKIVENIDFEYLMSVLFVILSFITWL